MFEHLDLTNLLRKKASSLLSKKAGWVWQDDGTDRYPVSTEERVNRNSSRATRRTSRYDRFRQPYQRRSPQRRQQLNFNAPSEESMYNDRYSYSYNTPRGQYNDMNPYQNNHYYNYQEENPVANRTSGTGLNFNGAGEAVVDNRTAPKAAPVGNVPKGVGLNTANTNTTNNQPAKKAPMTLNDYESQIADLTKKRDAMRQQLGDTQQDQIQQYANEMKRLNPGMTLQQAMAAARTAVSMNTQKDVANGTALPVQSVKSKEQIQQEQAQAQAKADTKSLASAFDRHIGNGGTTELSDEEKAFRMKSLYGDHQNAMEKTYY